jgi:hypothetical protein
MRKIQRFNEIWSYVVKSRGLEEQWNGEDIYEDS